MNEPHPHAAFAHGFLCRHSGLSLFHIQPTLTPANIFHFHLFHAILLTDSKKRTVIVQHSKEEI